MMAELSDAEKTRRGFLWGTLMVLTGTLCIFITKAQYSIRVIGTETCVIDSVETHECYFDKPWFGVLQMKVGMAGCLVAVRVQQGLQPPPNKPLESVPVTWSTVLWFIVPAVTDTVCTMLANLGLLWIAPSIYEMTSSTMIVFNAIILVYAMGTRLFVYQYASISLVVVGATLVACAGLLMHPTTSTASGMAPPSNQVVGLVCILASRFITAVQCVVEEWLLTKLHVRPAVLVGWEGLWGLAFFVVLAPLLTWTPAPSATSSQLSVLWHEDFLDTFAKLTASPVLLFTVVVYAVCIGFANFCGSCVTKYLSSVMTGILATTRTLAAWVTALTLYYIVGWTSPKSPGEAWTRWSWLQLGGFVVLAVGTLMYKSVLRVPIPWLYRDAGAPEESPLLRDVQGPIKLPLIIRESK